MSQTVAEVDIEETGVYKYILIKVLGQTTSRTVVCGFASCEYHGANELCIVNYDSKVFFMRLFLFSFVLLHVALLRDILSFSYSIDC